MQGTIVAVAVPSGELMWTDTAFDMSAMISHTVLKGIQIAQLNSRMAYIGPSRNELVEMAKKVKADYLFFLDSDMRVPPDAILRLLAHRKEIVGANYTRRKPPFVAIIKKDVNGKPLNYSKGGLVNIGEIPTGCLLIDMRVFDKLEQPYFTTLGNRGSNVFQGEDLFFCQLAREEGFRVYCDLDLSTQIGHIGTAEYYIKR